MIAYHQSYINWFHDVLKFDEYCGPWNRKCRHSLKVFALFFKLSLISGLKHCYDFLSLKPETRFSKTTAWKTLEIIIFLFLLFVYLFVISELKFQRFKHESSAMQLRGKIFAWASSTLSYDSTTCWKSVSLIADGEKLFLHSVLVSKTPSFNRVCWSYFQRK